MFDFQVAIIGGGVVGSAIAMELAKYDIPTVVFEAGSDVASGTSKANSGVIHSGINSPPGSLKAKFCVEGNQMIQELARKMHLEIKMVGKYVVAINEDEISVLEELKEVGIKNGVPGLKIVDGDDVKKNEPNVKCCKALWVPTAGIISPYKFTIALAETAAENGVRFMLETKVVDIKAKEQKGGFSIITNRGEFTSEVLINAAGVHCREIVSMLMEPDFDVYPCRGEYLVLDKEYSHIITSMIYPVPPRDKSVLGIHITPTIEGNILLGPSMEYVDDVDDTRTTREVMKMLMEEAKKLVPSLPDRAVINAYSGIRCKLKKGEWADYRIEEYKDVPGMINLLGIESPGLTAAPAIGKYVVEVVARHVELKKKEMFRYRNAYGNRFADMDDYRKSEVIKQNSGYGRIVCRCEQVTEAEVIEALSNPLGARTLASVKYRCRAGMGRCQGGFCTQHVVRIMEERFGMEPQEIKLKSPGSFLFAGRTRKEEEND